MNRRGACPSLAEPMRTGDGLLVRLPRPDRGYAPGALAALARAAGELGNGSIEVTARGNVQLRGLAERTIPALAEAIAHAGIVVPTGPAIECDPLAGIDPAIARDPLPLAVALRAAIAALPPGRPLAPKLSILIDGGGRLGLDALAADIRLTASDAGWTIALGGTAEDATSFAEVSPEAAAELVLRLIDRIADHGPGARARAIIAAEGIGWFGRPAAAPPSAARRPVDPIGMHPTAGSLIALGIGLPFGHVGAGILARLCALAAEAGGNGIRPSPGRALLVTGLTREAAGALAGDARRAGLIVDADDPRCRIAACAGAPACASAHIDTRAIAALIAAAGMAGEVHVSGCTKGCAHPDATPLTIVGTAGGGCDIVRHGTASSPAVRHLAPAALREWLARPLESIA